MRRERGWGKNGVAENRPESSETIEESKVLCDSRIKPDGTQTSQNYYWTPRAVRKRRNEWKRTSSENGGARCRNKREKRRTRDRHGMRWEARHSLTIYARSYSPWSVSVAAFLVSFSGLSSIHPRLDCGWVGTPPFPEILSNRNDRIQQPSQPTPCYKSSTTSSYKLQIKLTVFNLKFLNFHHRTISN